MLQLWRKAAQYFLKYPLLWLPFICADVCAFSLTRLRVLARPFLLQWCVTSHHSVLDSGIASSSLDDAAVLNAMRISAAWRWITQLANRYLYAIALVVTAALVCKILLGEYPILADGISRMRGYFKKSFLYAIKYYFLSLILFVLIDFPTDYWLLPTIHSKHLFYRVLSNCEVLLTGLITAWWMAPIAIQLLRPADHQDISPEDKNLARGSYIFTAIVSFALGQLLYPALDLLNLQSNVKKTASLAFCSVAVNIPYIFLYIVFALIAFRASQEVAAQPGSRARPLLEVLMPLHFPKHDQPKA